MKCPRCLPSILVSGACTTYHVPTTPHTYTFKYTNIQYTLTF